MKKVYLFLVFWCIGLAAFGQTTVTIYAGGGLPATTRITGSVDTAGGGTITTDSILSDPIERGYAVFDLSSIPAGATIQSVQFGFNVQIYTVLFGTPSGWAIKGYAGDLSTVSTVATLWADCASGTTLYTTSFGTATGNQLFASAAPAVTFVGAHIGSKVSMCFNSAGYVRYNITGAVGTATTTGTHAPFMTITYCMPITPGPSDTVCPGSTLALTDSIGGGTWSSSLTSVATVGSGSGVVTGVSSGIATITYVVGTCTSTVAMNVIGPKAINMPGSDSICAGSSVTLTDSVAGGTWTSSNLAIASISPLGVLTGITDGAATITYTIGGCYVTKVINVKGPSAISPSTATICPGNSTTFTDGSSGGTWSVKNADATIGSGTGIAVGVSAGTDTVSYTQAGCSVTATLIVTSGSSPITGTTPMCTGTTATFTDATSGGTWSSSATGVAAVGATTGVVTAVAAGTATITYSAGGCTSTLPITVQAGPAAISPSSASICVGTSVSFTDATAGGAWTSSASGVASVSGGSVLGVSAGISTISYTVGSCSSTASVTVVAAPGAITPAGPVVVCAGTTVTLADGTAGGTWTSSASGIATVGSTTGIVTGVATGAATITYSVGTCTVTKTISVSVGAAAITPSSATICAGSNVTLTDATGGGAWTSSNAAVATVASGLVTGIAPGTAIISYTAGTCSVLASITVNAAPASITPATAVSICAGTTTTLADATVGGTWTSGSTGVATVGGTTGIVTGVAGGTATISYTVGGCSATKVITVIGSVSPISPASASICVGSASTFTDASSGGTWSSSSAAATVSGGVVTGVSVGTATISYTVGSCSATSSVTVNTAPAAITPASGIICAGTTLSLSDATSGGSWTSGSGTIASVSGAGVVTGIAAGIATISYSIGTCAATASITVSNAPTAIAPTSGTVCVGNAISFTDGVSGGAWTTSDATVASASLSGAVTGVAAGTATISYTIGTCSVTVPVTVNPLANPGTISGASSICGTASTALTETVGLGTWSASNGHATVSSSGIVTGVTAGIDIISYSVTNSCGTQSATFSITVDSGATAGTLLGPSMICAGSFTVIADSVTGGTYSVSNTHATIDSTGTFSGISAGVDTIIYLATNACGVAVTTKIMTVMPLPDTGSISGPNVVCGGANISLSETVSGGTWVSSNTAIATVSASGVVTGVAGGTVTISYAVTNGCGTLAAVWPVTVNAAASAGTITGASSVCAGSLITLTDPVSGGSYSSSNANATVVPTTGVVSGVSAGIDTISYSVTTGCGTATTYKIITVDASPVPAAIGGGNSVCLGTTLHLTDATVGGTWSASNGNASVSPISGVLTGLTVGVDTIYYTNTNACGTGVADEVVTVSISTFAGVISGPTSVCVGSLITLSDPVTGGTWSLSNGDASSPAPGVLLGVTAGVEMVSYTYTNGCGTAVTTYAVTVSLFPTAGIISGSSIVCQGATATLSESLAGGTWSSGDLAVATVGVGDGIVTGVALGTDTISYTIVNACGTVGTFKLMTVLPMPNAGTITGAAPMCVGSTLNLTDAAGGGTWSASNGDATVNGATGLVTAVTAGTDMISYTVSNSCGSATATVNIAVVTFPVSGTITGANTVCTGSTITLADVDTGGTWVASNTNATISATTGIVTGVAVGTDSMFYLMNNACGTATSNFVITVNPTPVIGAITGATTLCSSSTTPLADTTIGGTWSSSNTAIGTVDATGMFTGIVAGYTTISYSLTNAFGCTGVATSADTVLAAPGSSAISGTLTVCVGASTSLADAATGGTWASGNSTVATVGLTTGIVTGVAADVVTIYYTVTNICGSTNDSAIVTVNAGPLVAPIAGTAATVCAGASTVLTDATAGGTWISGTPSLATIGSTSGVVNGIAAGTVVFTYQVTNSSGCATDATFSITFGGSLGSTSISPASATLCHGNPVVLNALSTGSGLTYQWMINGNDIAGATSQTFTADSAATYSVTLSNGSCQETLGGATVSNSSTPSITFTAPNVLSTTASFATYQWYKNGVAIPGATSASYDAVDTGTYFVIAADMNGCADTSASYDIKSGSGSSGIVKVNGGGNEVSLFPNPATNVVFVSSSVSVNVKVMSPDGTVLMSVGQAKQIDLSNFAGGMYLIQVSNTDGLVLKTEKLLKL